MIKHITNSLESNFASIALKIPNMKVLREGITIELVPIVTNSNRNYRSSNYTPDYYLEYGKRKIAIEIKGFLTRENKTIAYYKLANWKFQRLGVEFYVLEHRGKDWKLAKHFHGKKDKNTLFFKNIINYEK